MRAALVSSLTFFMLLSGCGGGGGSSTIFDFAGLWLSSFVVSNDLCGLSPNDTGTVAFTISQTSDVVTVSSSEIIWQGSTEGNGFTGVLADLSLFECPDGTPLSATTSSLVFTDTTEEKAESVALSFFGDCPTFTEQCELTYSGSAIRLVGDAADAASGANNLF